MYRYTVLISLLVIALSAFALFGAGSVRQPQLNSHSSINTPLSSAPLAPHVPGELIVKFKDAVKSDRITSINESFGAKIVKQFRLTKAYHVTVNPNANLADIIGAYNQLPEVAYAEPNYRYFASVVPNDPFYSNLWGMDMVKAPEAWDRQTGSDSVVVAVIDTGLDHNHQDIAANVWMNPGEFPNGLDDDNNGYIDDFRGWNFIAETNNPMDDNMHGTHTSGTVGAVGNNGVGVVGVCWNVSIMPLKFLDAGGSGTLDDAVEAIEYATENGAKIMSNSWGGGGYSETMFQAITIANQQNILFIAAAGNSMMNTDLAPEYPACYQVPNIIAVAATTNLDTMAYFSNYGLNSVHLGAPGAGIYSTIPNNLYTSLDGTSMACPMVSGAAALVWSEFPQYTNIQVKNRILNYVDLTQAMAGRVTTGGRLNVRRAIFGGIMNPTPTPGPTPGPCPINAVAQGSTNESKLDAIRLIRDTQLNSTAYGREWIQGYYDNMTEITSVLLRNPALFKEAYALLDDTVALCESLQESKPIHMQSAYKRALITLLEGISARADQDAADFLSVTIDLINRSEGLTVKELMVH